MSASICSSRGVSGTGSARSSPRCRLASGRYEPAIDRHRADASAVGIGAIPSHIVGRRYLLVGAQPVMAFKQVLERIRDEDAEPDGGPSAAPDD